ncbi:DNA cytosine methyltransferase [Streptomyces scopuliridis]
MPILELCAGYGGVGMAVEALTGDKVAYVAESDEAASLVLAHRFPHAPNIGDITVYDWTQLVGLVDIVTAGFSCQDISNAGPREGISGKRSRVWKDVAKAVGVLRPRLVFLENVAVIRSRGLDVVAKDLAAVGYDLWWTSFRASALGAAHHRDRWFGVAVPHAEGERRSAWRPEPAQQQGQVRRPSGSCRELSADADSARLEVGSVQSARKKQPTAVGSGVGAEDAHGAARQERLRAASGEAQEGGAWPDPR